MHLSGRMINCSFSLMKIVSYSKIGSDIGRLGLYTDLNMNNMETMYLL